MNPDSLLRLLSSVLEVAGLVATGIKLVLHVTGADKHHTVAQDVADGIEKSRDAIKVLLNGVQHGGPDDPPS